MCVPRRMCDCVYLYERMHPRIYVTVDIYMRCLCMDRAV